jgi:hypothetical protein
MGGHDSFQVKTFYCGKPKEQKMDDQGVTESANEMRAAATAATDEQLETMAKATMPKPFHGLNGMTVCKDIARGGTTHMHLAGRGTNDGPLMRALADWAERFGHVVG